MNPAWSWSDVVADEPPHAPAWSWSDVQQVVARKAQRFGGSRRPRGTLSRFSGTAAHALRDDAELASDHAALRDGRTLFPTRVFDVGQVPRVLISGVNSAKIGRKIVKGSWRGLPIFTLTLEERATCPSTCSLLAACYGNAMPLARRVRPAADLIAAIESEVRALITSNPGGIAVRLHVLGDFYDADYARAWVDLVLTIPGLHVFGFTAHARTSEIGLVIAEAAVKLAGRWAIRFSVSPDAITEAGQATTIWRQPEASVVPEGIVCPAQTHRTEACGSCGLCWTPAAWTKRIAFIGHGMRRGRRTPQNAAGSAHGAISPAASQRAGRAGGHDRSLAR